jgi:hypothetical protein
MGCMALTSCNTEKKITNTDIEVARGFIKDILDNNFKDAETFVLKEETTSILNYSKNNMNQKARQNWKTIKMQTLSLTKSVL